MVVAVASQLDAALAFINSFRRASETPKEQSTSLSFIRIRVGVHVDLKIDGAVV